MKLPVYSVQLQFTRPVAGGNPVSTNLISDYITALESGQSNPVKAVLAKEGVVTDEAIQKFLEKATGLHYRDTEGPYICDYMVQANLRSAALALGIWGSVTGALHRSLTQGISMPARIHLSGDADSEFITRAIQPIQQGKPQPTLATFEVIPAGAEVEFTITIANPTELTKDRLKMLFSWGGNIGLGAKRALGYGKYELMSITDEDDLILGPNERRQGEQQEEAKKKATKKAKVAV